MKCKIFLAVLITVLIISSACTSTVCMKIAKRNVERNNVLTPVRSLSTDTGKSLTAPTGTSYMKVTTETVFPDDVEVDHETTT